MQWTKQQLWERFQKYYFEFPSLGMSLDLSRVLMPDGYFSTMAERITAAFAAMRDLEAGAIANPDEQRMVGHYWLRNSALAPNAQLRADIEETNKRIKQFAADVHAGRIAPADGKKFEHILLIGIGGSALG